jgi:hypothetical protein
LLPNFNTPAVDGQVGDAALAAALADGNAAGAAGGEDEPRDLRRSVTTLLVLCNTFCFKIKFLEKYYNKKDEL